jgi:hypothetical protein
MVALVPAACLRVPQATVSLSDVTREQVASIRESHEGFVRLYYARLRSDIDAFLRDQWVPAFLGRAVENAAFRGQLDVAYAVASLRPDAIQVNVNGNGELPPPVREALRAAIDTALTTHRARLGTVMREFTVEAERQIAIQRSAMLSEVDAQERLVLDHLGAAYGDLQDGQAALRAFLASAVQLQTEQDALVRKLGLLDEQTRAIKFLTSASDAAALSLERADKADDAIKSFQSLLRAARDSTNRPMRPPPR